MAFITLSTFELPSYISCVSTNRGSSLS